MVGALGVAPPNETGAIGVSLSVPSGVVTQTCAVTGAGAADAPTARVVAPAAAPVVSRAALSEAMMNLIRVIVVPSCNKMKQIRNLLCRVANQGGPQDVKRRGPNGLRYPPSDGRSLCCDHEAPTCNKWLAVRTGDGSRSGISPRSPGYPSPPCPSF